MINKIGLNDYNLERIQKELINKKLNLIDELFTFNESEFNINYLIKLNKYLFGDFYAYSDIGLRDLNKYEIESIEFYLQKIIEDCILYKEDIKEILFSINEIWNIQPFIVGNTRTLIAFLKVLKHVFLLDIDIDVNKEIVSNPGIFELNNFVNQKRLTRYN